MEGRSNPKVSMVVAAILRIDSPTWFRMLLSFAAARRWESCRARDDEEVTDDVDEDETMMNAFVVDAAARKVTTRT